MLDFHLYRVRVFPSKQLDFLRKEKKPTEILSEAIQELPTAELKKENVWHIGNLTLLTKGEMYFRLGRTYKSKMEVYREGNFQDDEFETSPYTHVVLDIELEVCAIAKKSKLSPHPRGIANQLRRLLNQSKTSSRFGAEFDIDELLDPEDFISQLRNASAISKFWVTFKRPNAWDADSDFVKPMQNLVKNTKAQKGKTEIQGEVLFADNLEKLARSAASTGDDAGALIQMSGRKKKVKKSLKGNPVVVKFEDLISKLKIQELMNEVKKVYRSVRDRKK